MKIIFIWWVMVNIFLGLLCVIALLILYVFLLKIENKAAKGQIRQHEESIDSLNVIIKQRDKTREKLNEIERQQVNEIAEFTNNLNTRDALNSSWLRDYGNKAGSDLVRATEQAESAGSESE